MASIRGLYFADNPRGMKINNFEQAFIVAKTKENERNTRLANGIPFNNNLVNKANSRDRCTVNMLGTNSINFEQENERDNIRLDKELKISEHNGHYFRTGYGKEFSCSWTPSPSSDFNSAYQEPLDAKVFPRGKPRQSKNRKHASRINSRRNNNSSDIKERSLKIVAMNVRGITNKKKSIECILTEQEIDIAIISEIGTRNMPKFPGYTSFINYKKNHKHMHGIVILVNNSIKKDVIRIPDESDLEIVHLRVSNTLPAVNIIGTYLNCESRSSVEDIKKEWHLFTDKVQQSMQRGEAVVCMGDFNRPLQAKKLSHGTNLLNDWLKEENVYLINNRKINTRIDPSNGSGSVLDLAIASEDLRKNVKCFKVDNERIMSAFSMYRRKGTINKKFSDHLSIKLVLNMPMIIRKQNNKRKPIINIHNKDGWIRYPEVTDKYADLIQSAIDNIEDSNKLESRLFSIDQAIKVEAFGVIWVRQGGNSRKRKKRESKEMNTLYNEYLEEIDSAISESLDRKDINSKMYKLKSLVTGPNIKPQEKAAINDPTTGELITDVEKIKEVSLAHNINILKKKAPLPQHEELIRKKQVDHESMMKRNSEEDIWSLDRRLFDKVLKRLKDKNKKMFFPINKAGPKYKDAIFHLMKRLIDNEEVPSVYDNTSLTQIWKKKGSALSLNNMRFIHMKCWRPKLLEAIIMEDMKSQIVAATPNIQIGGMPGHSSTEHLVTLKTWMKQLEERKESGILSLFDMEKFFDKESLLDCMHTLNQKANVKAKSYRMWYKLNENTKISVKTPVGESNTAPIFDSVGQGSFGAALISSLNIGCAIDELFKEDYSANIGQVELACLILQDDIMEMSSTVEQARNGCQKIDEMLKQKLLRANYDKSKYLILGRGNRKNKMSKELKETPLKMGDEILEKVVTEKYLGDIIHEKGCKESITATIKERMRKLIPKVEEIIQIANTPIMAGLRNSRIAFKLFEAIVIPALLNNCASWIGINKTHLDDLQKFQDNFVRRVLQVPKSITKALLEYDVQLWPMEWRIKERKLNFVRQILLTDNSNIAKNILLQEMEIEINGLGHECNTICNEINIPEIMNNSLSKRQIKNAIQEFISARTKEMMLASKKVADRISDDSHQITYLDRMGLTFSRMMIRYRARAIKGVKANCKRSWKNDLNCRFCNNTVIEDQEHLEVCTGLSWERRRLKMDTEVGKIIFFRRAKRKLEGRL